MRQSFLLSSMYVKNVRGKMIPLAIIPHHLTLRPRPPLKHTSLLPAPRSALAKLSPAVAVFQIHYANPDHIVRFWTAMLEADLHTQNIAAHWIELEFIVVSKPVKIRAAGDSSYRCFSIAHINPLIFRFPCHDFRIFSTARSTKIIARPCNSVLRY